VGVSHTLQIKASDTVGNPSDWTAATPFTLAVTQENGAGVVYTGAFKRAAQAGASGRYVKWAATAGRKATFTFSGTSVAFVSTRGRDRGKAEVWLDGVRVATLDLYGRTTLAARVVLVRALTGTGTHTLEVRVLGARRRAATSPRVDIDAFVVLR
jgi:hypothetical protein